MLSPCSSAPRRLADSVLTDKKGLIVSGLRPLLPEPNYKVRKAFAQTVITMASREYLSLEGGSMLVEFIVRQCSITKEEDERFRKATKMDADTVTPLQLRSMCDNILSLLTTTVPAMESVLWPYLLEVIVPTQYFDALSVVSKSLSHIASKKREADDEKYMIDFDKEVNLPKPVAIIPRLLVILSRPHERPNIGENVLNFLKSMGPVLHPSIGGLWDEVIPKLATYLKGVLLPFCFWFLSLTPPLKKQKKTEKSVDMATWNQNKWEDLINKLLIKTIEEVNDDEWITDLGEAMALQFQLYSAIPQQPGSGNPNHKAMLFKLLGVVLQKSTKKQFVRDKLEFMFNAVDHAVVEDRDGCAIGYGCCAASHLDIVLDKLNSVLNTDLKKKSGGLFDFLGGDSSPKEELMKCTTLLCYGHAAAKADKALIKSRLDVSILANILPLFATAKLAIVKARHNQERCVLTLLTLGSCRSA